MTVGDFYDMPWHRGWNPVPDREWMASVADRWAAFPASARPRPVVLVAQPEQVPGFDTDEAKVAWLEGPEPTGAEASAEPAPFATDRGPQLLPCVRFAVPGSSGPIVRADLTQVDVWSPPGRPHDEHWYGDVTADVDPSDPLGVVWRFAGSPEAYTDYPEAEVVETDTAVVVVPRPVERPGTDARRSYGQTREVAVQLARPVGGRVLLDVYGRAAVLLPRDS